MLKEAIYPVLRPVMRMLQYRIDQRLRQLPLPVDAPHVHTPGNDPDRVLLFGSGPAVGYGVLSNDLALPGHLARQLSAVTGRGVDLDVVADTELTAQSSVTMLEQINLWRYDAILLTIGVNNALMLTPVKEWRASIRAVLNYVAEHVPARTRILVMAIPPIRAVHASNRISNVFSSWIADRHGIALNRETRRIVAQYPHMTFVPFPPLDAVDEVRFTSAETHQRWAALIVPPLSEQLDAEPRDDEEPEFAPDEAARQAALDALGIVGTPAEERFDRIARMASQFFGTSSAISFIDHDRHWIKARVGFDRDEIPRAGSFGDQVIHGASVYVVEDSGDPESHFGIRFYAGAPIESAFGERIGVLSVFSGEPREWNEESSALLRDLALQVQRELLASRPQ